MKRLLTALALSLAVPLAPAWAQYTVNFRDADIRAFIEDAARVTGRTFIVDPVVQGKVSVVTQRALSRSEYFELFLSTLRANSLVAVPISGGGFRIQPVATAASTGGRVGQRGSPNNFVTEIFRLRSIEGPAAVESLPPWSARTGRSPRTDARSSSPTLPTTSRGSGSCWRVSTATCRPAGSSRSTMPARARSRLHSTR